MPYSAQSMRPFRDVNGKRWTHPSVAALMKLARQDECPEAVIRRLSRDLVLESKQLGWSGPPYDPEVLASLEDISIEAGPITMQADARIFPTPNGKLLIQCNRGTSRERQRFSVAHEIGHTLFPDCYERVRHRGNVDKVDFVHAELEQLCNLAASELLIPYDDVVSVGAGEALSMELAERLRRKFEVSREAILRRLCDVSTNPCAVIFLSTRLKPTEERMSGNSLPGFDEPTEKFRIDYSCVSATFGVHLPQHKSAPDNSVIHRALGNNFPSRYEDWGIPTMGEWLVQAAEMPRAPIGGKSRVSALLIRPSAKNDGEGNKGASERDYEDKEFL